MICLLDTHTILWSLFEPDKITDRIRTILENDSDTKLLSGVNLWEISLKYSLGKLELGNSDPNEIYDALRQSGYEMAELENLLLATYYQLPKKNDHRDPFDRLLVWQAISNGYTLISQDSKIEQYRADGLKIVLG